MGSDYVAIWGDVLAREKKGFWSLAVREPKLFAWVILLAVVMAFSPLACVWGLLNSQVEVLFAGLVALFPSAAAYTSIIEDFSPRNRGPLDRYGRLQKEAPSLASGFLASAHLSERCICDVLESVRSFRDEKVQRTRELRSYVFAVCVGCLMTSLFQGQLTALANGNKELAVPLGTLCLVSLALVAFIFAVRDIWDTISKTSTWNADYLIKVLELYKVQLIDSEEDSTALAVSS